MLVFDQLKKDDAQLRLLALIVLAGMLVLLAGLWWVQVVSFRYYQKKLEFQSVRTVRIPAVRGSILDREGRPLAENRPSYNISLFLEDLSKRFQSAAYQAQQQLKNQLVAQEEARLKRTLTPRERRKITLPPKLNYDYQMLARYLVASNLVGELSRHLNEPVSLPQKEFQRSYERQLAIPLTFLPNINSNQLARFVEQSTRIAGMDLDIQSVRGYPRDQVAAHLIGYVRRSRGENEEDEISYNYRLEDYTGVSGIEKVFDAELRGKPGVKSVLVNNLGFRRGETVWSPAEAGMNVVLTINLELQRATEQALRETQANVQGAALVMDSRNGDVLAMASSPAYDPNFFTTRQDPERSVRMSEYLNDPELRPEINRSMYKNTHPGSIFKIVVGLAALEQGVLDPTAQFDSPGYFQLPNDRMNDTADAGKYDLNRAMAKSCNTYFAHYGTQKGVLQKIISIGQQLHLGEKTGLIPGQETPGIFPTQKTVASHWYIGDTANLCIGQGKIDVSPLQMAVMVSAVANGGKVFWPRLASRLESQDGFTSEKFAEGRLRDTLKVTPRNLELIRAAMREDVTSPEGSGREAGTLPWAIAGKTGTAQVERQNRVVDRELQQTWFVAFGPYESPRYTVVVTVEGGISGARTCVPAVKKIYEALIRMEKQAATRTGTLALTH